MRPKKREGYIGKVRKRQGEEEERRGGEKKRKGEEEERREEEKERRRGEERRGKEKERRRREGKKKRRGVKVDWGRKRVMAMREHFGKGGGEKNKKMVMTVRVAGLFVNVLGRFLEKLPNCDIFGLFVTWLTVAEPGCDCIKVCRKWGKYNGLEI